MQPRARQSGPRSLAAQLLAALLLATLLIGCAGTPRAIHDATAREISTSCSTMRDEELCRQVAAIRGVNLGNALEAPREGAWGVRLTEQDFELVAAAGFNAVRVPVRWSAHALDEPPYTIREAFFERVDWVLERSRANNLLAVINVHHYDELFADPSGHGERFRAIWRQISARYAGTDESMLWFEILNEPHGRLQGIVWNRLFEQTLAIIRESNPTRPVVAGGDTWNSVTSLDYLGVPDDSRLVLTFHYYLPFAFTHQGAEWVDNMDRHLGTEWTGSESERNTVERHVAIAARVAEATRLPVLLGEFGAYSKAPMDSRVRWTAHVARSAERAGIGWFYWELRAGFGVYDPNEGWVMPIRDALLPDARR